MKIKQIVWRLLVVLTLAGILAGCTTATPTSAPTAAPSAAPTSAPTTAAATAVAPTLAATVDLQPTFNAIKTQSAATVVANLTQNAPTSAPTTAATKAPVLTATLATTSTPAKAATATTKPILTPWTLVPTMAAYSCRTVDLSPKPNVAYPTSSSFDMLWVVQNTGTNRWLATETMAWFVDGRKMQKFGDFLPLKADVAPNATYTVAIDMLAPATAGTYHMDWKLTYGNVTICSMSMNILIQ